MQLSQETHEIHELYTILSLDLVSKHHYIAGLKLRQPTLAFIHKISFKKNTNLENFGKTCSTTPADHTI